MDLFVNLRDTSWRSMVDHQECIILAFCCCCCQFLPNWYWKSGGDGLYKKVSPLEILISLFYVIKCRHRSFMFRIIFKNNDKIHTLIKDVIVKICNQSKLKSIKDKHHFLLGRFDSHPRVIVNLLLTINLE